MPQEELLSSPGIRTVKIRSNALLQSLPRALKPLPQVRSVSYTHLTLPTIYSV